jgi:rare lipoprotein A
MRSMSGALYLLFCLGSGACQAPPPRTPVARAYRARSARAPSPVRRVRGHRLRGLGTWYGRPFHGRRTASGERFNMHRLTAAHRTLPFGTLVRVTNLKNRRTVTVRITDRGPFGKGRIIDLSRAGARRLHMLRAGVVPVRLRVLKWGAGRRRAGKQRRKRAVRSVPTTRPETRGVHPRWRHPKSGLLRPTWSPRR